MPSSSRHQDDSPRPAVSLAARKVEQLAAHLCDVHARGGTPYCETHGNVVAAGAPVCGHVRRVVNQIAAVVLEAERASVHPPADPLPGHRPAEVRMEVSA